MMSANPRIFAFYGGRIGPWTLTSMQSIRGEPLPPIQRLQVHSGNARDVLADVAWTLRGVTSNDRYVVRAEKSQLRARQPALGRAEANCAALIPIRKTAAWWALTQDERRQIFEERSHHTQVGLEYLPAIARRLHHCRDLAEPEPFDFLTWFEFAEEDSSRFDHLLERLRASPEWD